LRSGVDPETFILYLAAHGADVVRRLDALPK
jgi:hypothetical protein